MSDWVIHEGDCRTVLDALPERSVQTCVTSPPYWLMRDYATAIWKGGEPDCDHQACPRQGKRGQRNDRRYTAAIPYRAQCGKCGATRRDHQIGLEDTIEQYVAEMVAVFRRVWRVLRDDGTLWLNLGDSYMANPKGSTGVRSTLTGSHGNQSFPCGVEKRRSGALKSKDLIGLPWRVAFALQEDGWYLRSDIIWAKPCPMPESVTDRPTRAHEYLFLLAKARRYYYDADAIREPLRPKTLTTYGIPREQPEGDGPPLVKSANWGRGVQIRKPRLRGDGEPAGANKRDVWTVASQPFTGAHFATFPPRLIEPCVLAGCPVGGTVLDPFAGAGTTGMVALRHGRNFIGIELRSAYAAMARERIRGDAPLLNTSEVA